MSACVGMQAKAAAAGGGAKKRGLATTTAPAERAAAGPKPAEAPKKRPAKRAAGDGGAGVKRAMSAYIISAPRSATA